MFSQKKWKEETATYVSRISKLAVVDTELEDVLRRFPGLMRRYPNDKVAVKHRLLIFANQSMQSATEVLRSVQLLTVEGHFLAAGHCIRLLHEVWGSLLYARAKVLTKAEESGEGAAIADARLQRLLLGTNSRPLLPAGMREEINKINVMEFIREAEAAVAGFAETYEFLCDISHPTYMHWYFHQITYDFSWSNDLKVAEVNRILELVTSAAEKAVSGVRAAVCEIYLQSLPDIEAEVATYATSPPSTEED
ncbi:MAG TPA: hypothetical protein VIV01_11590 [Hyphomicrobiaceae bacterium]